MSYAKNGVQSAGPILLSCAWLDGVGCCRCSGQAAGNFLDAGGVLGVGTTFTGMQEGNGSLLIPGLGAAIECTAADVEEGEGYRTRNSPCQAQILKLYYQNIRFRLFERL